MWRGSGGRALESSSRLRLLFFVFNGCFYYIFTTFWLEGGGGGGGGSSKSERRRRPTLGFGLTRAGSEEVRESLRKSEKV